MDELVHHVWSDPAWRAEVEAWVAAELGRAGAGEVRSVSQPRLRAWSTQLSIETGLGRYWFKESTPALHFEAALVSTLARIVPDHVLTPVAVRPERGWLLTADAGPTLSAASGSDPSTEAVWVRVLQGFADLQRRVAAHGDALLAAGLPSLLPSAAPEWLTGYATELAALPDADPRKISGAELEAVGRAADRLREPAGELTSGPVPASLEHNDLHHNNTFVPSSLDRTDGSLRYFDFGDSVWAHPFTTLVIPLRVVAREWSVDEDDPRMTRLRDAYLEVWSDLAPAAELRRLADAAARFSALHRAHSWRLWMSTSDERYRLLYEDGPAYWVREVVRDELGAEGEAVVGPAD